MHYDEYYENPYKKFNKFLNNYAFPFRVKKSGICEFKKSKEIANGFIYVKYIFCNWRYTDKRVYSCVFSIIKENDELECGWDMLEDISDNALVGNALPLFNVEFNGDNWKLMGHTKIKSLCEDNIDIYDGSRFFELFKLYIDYLFSHSNIKINDTCTGWIENEYLGIYSPHINTYFTSRMFNGALLSNDDETKVDSSEIVKNAQALFNVVKDNPKLLLIISYAIMSFASEYYERYECQRDKEATDLDDRFAICICGRNKNLTINAVANIFINSLIVNCNRINTIASKSENINISDINFRIYDKMYIKDFPLLVYSKSGKLSADNRKIKNIFGNYLGGAINYYPVFLSTTSLDVQQCIDIDISDLKDIPCKGEAAFNLKESINFLYFQFIVYLQRCLKEWKEDKRFSPAKDVRNYTIGFTNKLYERYTIDGNTEMYFYRLYLYMCLFAEFLRDNDAFSLANEYKNLMQKLLPSVMDCSVLPLSSEKSALTYFAEYIKAIFIDKNVIPEYIYFEGYERMDSDCYCYYLEGTKYFDDFTKRYPIDISRAEFNNILKVSNVIKYREGRSIVMKRCEVGKSKKPVTCLVVKRDEISKFEIRHNEIKSERSLN